MGEALKQQIDIKFIITICGFVALMGGFYYTTALRLETLEGEVKELKKTNNRLIVVEERLKAVQDKPTLYMKLLLILIASSSLLWICSCEHGQADEKTDIPVCDSSIVDTIIDTLFQKIPTANTDCVSNSVCTQRMQEEAEQLDRSYDTILEILKLKIDSAKLRKIVNKKSLKNGKEKLKHLKAKRKENRKKRQEQNQGY